MSLSFSRKCITLCSSTGKEAYAQFISINFEDLNFSHLQTAKSLHDEITKRAAEINGKVYLFFDEIQEVKDWEKCINSLRISLDCDIYITGSNI